MIFESIRNVHIPKIGFGTSRVGGRIIPNRRRDAYWLGILRSALDLGYTHLDTAELYALGYSEELIGRALREVSIKREAIFITTKVFPIHLQYDRLLRACENSLRRLATDYIDLYLIHMPNPLIALQDTFRGLNRLVRQGKVRFVGVSNFGLDRLKESQRLSETPIFTDQIPYNLYQRSYVKEGVLDYCQQNDILVTAYSPVRPGPLRTDDTLRSMAGAHRSTPLQIALAWLIKQPRVVTIPMSFNVRHQQENLESVNIELSPEEMDRLTRLR